MAKAKRDSSIFSGRTCLFSTTRAARSGVVIAGRTKSERRFALTVDFETLGEKDPALRDTVTLRDRDSMQQERVAIQDLPAILRERIR